MGCRQGVYKRTFGFNVNVGTNRWFHLDAQTMYQGTDDPENWAMSWVLPPEFVYEEGEEENESI